MGTIEAIGSDGATPHHVITRDTVHKVFVCRNHIRARRFCGVVDKVHQRILKAEVAHFIAPFIESEYAIEADGFLAHEESAERYILLHTAAGPYAHYFQRAFLRFLRAGGKVDIRQRINLVHHDVAVVGADTRGDTRDALAVVASCDGVELSTLHIALYAAFVKERSHHVHSVLVADQDDFVGKKLRLQVQVKRTAIRIDNQLRCRKCFHSTI